MLLKIKLMACFTLCIFTTDCAAQERSILKKPEHAKRKSASHDSVASQENGKYVESFELVWKTIRDTHWDPSLVDESWTRQREILLPKVVAAKTISECRTVISELIGSLGQSHFGIIPNSSYEVISGESLGGGNFDVGITVRLIEDELVVFQVRSDSPGARSGVKPGWCLVSCRGQKANDLVGKFRQAAHGPQRAETTAGLVTSRMLSGGNLEQIQLEFVDSVGGIRKMRIGCEASPGKIAKLGHLPPMRVGDETRTLENNIGYYSFNAFLDPVRIMPAYRKAVRDEKHSAGLVIDLRGNIGGLAIMTMGMAGEFVDEKKILGTMTMKGTILKFVVNPRANPIEVPVAILVDECSISSAEIFAGGLQDNGLAKVFGKRTAGLAYPSTVIKLPNGDGFQYAFADYHSANGQRLEKNGVVPDTEIELTKQKLLENDDPVLKAAVDWIVKSGGG